MNICKLYRVNSSELRHHCISFEITAAVQVYISWEFDSLLLIPNVSEPFSPQYPKVLLTVFVVLHCAVAHTVHKTTNGSLQFVRTFDLVLRHCLIPDFFCLSHLDFMYYWCFWIPIFYYIFFFPIYFSDTCVHYPLSGLDLN